MSALHDEPLPSGLAGERLDRVVAALAGCARAEAAALVAAGRVEVDGEVVTAKARRVPAGATLNVEPLPLQEGETLRAEPEVQLDVRYEDDDLLVIDKPAGLVVHPGAGHRTGTLAGGLLARYPEIATVGEPDRPGIVHRLDRGTSGLLVVARTERAREALADQFAARQVRRSYDALVSGHPQPGEGMVDAPIGRSPRRPTQMAVVTEGRPAQTRYRVVERFSRPAELALVDVRPATGRTHQIRVHLSSIGHAIVGDTTYGGADAGLGIDRPFLHARSVALAHPATGEPVSFEAPLPVALRDVLERLS